MKEIFFTKMHGLGNDYIYINCLEAVPADAERLAVEMSDRHFGVGGDGIILIMPSKVADFRMRMFNADGSEGKMCGNASRCIGKYVYDRGLTDKTEVSLETLSGIKILKLCVNDGKVDSVTVDMGAPVLDCERVPVRYGADQMIAADVATKAGVLKVTAVSMGNPHGVVFIDESPEVFPVHEVGRELEMHAMWPDRANIEFAHVVSPDLIEMRVWERGSGETLACGTGACATAVAAETLGFAGARVDIKLRGGVLSIDRDPVTGHVLMTGPATTVMDGRYYRTDIKFDDKND